MTRDIVDVALEIAEADPTIGQFIQSNPYELLRAAGTSGNEVYVSVEFNPPVEPSSWPRLDVCEIGGIEGPATGLDLLVDLDTAEVIALSPRWGEVSCLEPAP